VTEPRFAVISDVHGNARALDAVLADIRRRGIRRILQLGDCLYGPFDPRPAVEALRDLDLETVSGNEDRILVEGATGAQVSRMARFTLDRLRQGDRDWLARLPRTLEREEVAMFHGTPTDDTVYLLTTPLHGRLVPRQRLEVERLLGEISGSVILCGHDHTASTRPLDDGRTVVNPGSVGCPAYRDDAPEPHVVEAGSPHARYAIVDRSGDLLRVEQVCVPYDWASAAAEAEAHGFPGWAYAIRHGRAMSHPSFAPDGRWRPSRSRRRT
jgi:predicted phosphodiesterase